MADTVLIYGGTGGIGLAVANKLKEAGYKLHLVARNEERLANSAAALGAAYTAGDAQDESLFPRVAEEAGPELAGLVYAVGTIRLRSLRQVDAADFLYDYQVNALGAALAIKASLKTLRKGGRPSSVVLFSSVAAGQGFSNHTSIAMAKGAVNGLTLSLAAELAPKVRVNAVAPSLTDTPLAKELTSNLAFAESLARMHPMQRLGKPDDIAGLASYLLSPEADWITGQVFAVDGGRSTLRIHS